MEAANLKVGELFAGKFRVIERLAAGGMGVVYRVEQVGIAQERALKVLHPQFASDPSSRLRFEGEAKASARIASEHVVQVIDAGVDPASGAPWLSMELLRGQTLDSLIRQRGALAATDVVEIFRQLCHALAAAHRAGLVHRDLKPENIFVSESRRSDVSFTVKVLDFGIAKWMQENRTSATVSAVIGSPMYMAPEQFESAGRVRAATDVWALGLIAYQLLTGRPYWIVANGERFSMPQLMSEIVIEPIEPATTRAGSQGVEPSLLPPAFDTWFSRCVVRRVDARFSDAAAALDGLVGVFAGSMPTASVHLPAAGAAAPASALTTGLDIALAATQAALPAAPNSTTAPLSGSIPLTPPPRRRGRAVLFAVGAGSLTVFGAVMVFAVLPGLRGRVAPAGGAVRCGHGQHASGGRCCDPGEEWVESRGHCVCLAPGGCQTPPAVVPTAATLADAAMIRDAASGQSVAAGAGNGMHSCIATWRGAMRDSYGGRGSAMILVTANSAPSCGRLFERWGTAQCEFEIRDCTTEGRAFQAVGVSTTRGCPSPSPIRLNCSETVASLHEGAPGSEATGMLTRQ